MFEKNAFVTLQVSSINVTMEATLYVITLLSILHPLSSYDLMDVSVNDLMSIVVLILLVKVICKTECTILTEQCGYLHMLCICGLMV